MHDTIIFVDSFHWRLTLLILTIDYCYIFCLCNCPCIHKSCPRINPKYYLPDYPELRCFAAGDEPPEFDLMFLDLISHQFLRSLNVLSQEVIKCVKLTERCALAYEPLSAILCLSTLFGQHILIIDRWSKPNFSKERCLYYCSHY